MPFSKVYRKQAALVVRALAMHKFKNRMVQIPPTSQMRSATPDNSPLISTLFFMSLYPPHSEQGPHSGRGISPQFVHLIVGLRSGEQSVVTGMCCSKAL
jgi:hypothetical protein